VNLNLNLSPGRFDLIRGLGGRDRSDNPRGWGLRRGGKQDGERAFGAVALN
jgi:hypothetical protein